MYTPKDVEILVDAFVNISKKGIENVKAEDFSDLLEYPENVVQEFVNCIRVLPTTENYIKEHYNAILVYIAIRLNLV